MLLNLYVKNMALIEEADISFTQGLNILTGETGAGKSIIIGSVNVALGNKVSSEIIRKGAEYALVELTFKLEGTQKIQALKDLDIEELDEGEVVISRKITPIRSSIKINGETVTASQVRKIASYLIDIHGQHEHQSLLDEAKHLELVDLFAGTEIIQQKEKLKETFKEYSIIKTKLEKMSCDADSRQREISFIQFELNEIESANLQPNEDNELEIQFRKMSNSQKIMEEISVADTLIGRGYDNATDMISKAVKSVLSVCTYDDSLSDMAQSLSDIESMIDDVGREITKYMDDCEFNEEEYIRVQNRLNIINNLKMKYGQSIEEILQYAEDKQLQVDEYNNYDAIRDGLDKEYCLYAQKLQQLCDELTYIRQISADKLASDIKKALIELNFLEVKFQVQFETLDHFTPNGKDFIRFIISTNPGEDMKPLAKIASGGEMSRIMLAIKTVLADNDDIETLIFDEIDTGISGRTAQMVADKMNDISKMHQIICITHLPQIASMADSHFVIEKSTNSERTTTQINLLNYEQSVGELARLLGGAKITDTVISNAREMKKLAKTVK